MWGQLALTAFGRVTSELDHRAKQIDERTIPRRWSGRLRRAIEAEAIAASTSMEGVPVTVEDTLRILAGDPPGHVQPRDPALVTGYRDAIVAELVGRATAEMDWPSPEGARPPDQPHLPGLESP